MQCRYYGLVISNFFGTLCNYFFKDILCDGPVAQSLGVEEVDPDVMKRKSRPRNDPIITRAFINRVLISVAMMVTGTMIVYVKEIIYESSAKRLTTMVNISLYDYCKFIKIDIHLFCIIRYVQFSNK